MGLPLRRGRRNYHRSFFDPKRADQLGASLSIPRIHFARSLYNRHVADRASFDGLTLLKAEACLLDDAAERPHFVIAPTGQNFTALLLAASIGALTLAGENVVLTTPHNFIRSIRHRYGQMIAQKAVNNIKIQAPYLSAHPLEKAA